MNPQNLSPKLLQILADLKTQDSLHHFAPKLVQQIGYPQWEKAATNQEKGISILDNNSSNTVFLIPFKNEKSGYISAYLSCTIAEEGIRYSLHTRQSIIGRINRADTSNQYEMAGFALVIAYFEKQVYNRDTLWLPGCKLSGFTNAGISFSATTKPRTLGWFEPITICGNVWVTGSNPQAATNSKSVTLSFASGHWQWLCRTSTTYVQEVPMDDGGGSNTNCMAPDGTYYWWCIQSGGGGGFLDSRTINGVTYTENDYPGMYDGYQWAWWEDDQWVEDNFHFGEDNRNGVYDRLTAEEKRLIKLFPLDALLINSNRKKAEGKTKEIFGQNGLNDKSDAFRHAYWQALNERDCGNDLYSLQSIAKLFADAHEELTPPLLQLEKEMDLWNNQIGFNEGDVIFPILTSDSYLSDKILEKLLSGNLRYLKPIKPPMYDPENGQVINPNGDPHFYGEFGTRDLSTATHGIIPGITLLTPTNH